MIVNYFSPNVVTLCQLIERIQYIIVTLNCRGDDDFRLYLTSFSHPLCRKNIMTLCLSSQPSVYTLFLKKVCTLFNFDTFWLALSHGQSTMANTCSLHCSLWTDLHLINLSLQSFRICQQLLKFSFYLYSNPK